MSSTETVGSTYVQDAHLLAQAILDPWFCETSDVRTILSKPEYQNQEGKAQLEVAYQNEVTSNHQDEIGDLYCEISGLSETSDQAVMVQGLSGHFLEAAIRHETSSRIETEFLYRWNYNLTDPSVSGTAWQHSLWRDPLDGLLDVPNDLKELPGMIADFWNSGWIGKVGCLSIAGLLVSCVHPVGRVAMGVLGAGGLIAATGYDGYRFFAANSELDQTMALRDLGQDAALSVATFGLYRLVKWAKIAKLKRAAVLAETRKLNAERLARLNAPNPTPSAASAPSTAPTSAAAPAATPTPTPTVIPTPAVAAPLTPEAVETGLAAGTSVGSLAVDNVGNLAATVVDSTSGVAIELRAPSGVTFTKNGKLLPAIKNAILAALDNAVVESDVFTEVTTEVVSPQPGTMTLDGWRITFTNDVITILFTGLDALNPEQNLAVIRNLLGTLRGAPAANLPPVAAVCFEPLASGSFPIVDAPPNPGNVQILPFVTSADVGAIPDGAVGMVEVESLTAGNQVLFNVRHAVAAGNVRALEFLGPEAVNFSTRRVARASFLAAFGDWFEAAFPGFSFATTAVQEVSSGLFTVSFNGGMMTFSGNRAVFYFLGVGGVGKSNNIQGFWNLVRTLIPPAAEALQSGPPAVSTAATGLAAAATLSAK